MNKGIVIKKEGKYCIELLSEEIGHEAIKLLKKIDKFIDSPTNSVGFNSQFQIEIKQLLSKIETFNLNPEQNDKH